METFHVAIAFILGIALPLAAQAWDRRRLTVDQRARAWNKASWGAALYAFGPLSMIGWCWVTRHEWGRWRRESFALALFRSALLLLQGTLASLLVVCAITGVDALLRLAEGHADDLRSSGELFLGSGILVLMVGLVILGLQALIRLVTGDDHPRPTAL